MEQKLPATQEKLTEEQAVSLKLMGTTWSRSSRAAMEKITVQQWMWSGGAPTGAGLSCSPCRGATEDRE